MMVHQAGAMNGLVQPCSRCGVVLLDYRNTYGIGDWKASGFQEGALVEVAGGYKGVLRDGEATCPVATTKKEG